MQWGQVRPMLLAGTAHGMLQRLVCLPARAQQMKSPLRPSPIWSRISKARAETNTANYPTDSTNMHHDAHTIDFDRLQLCIESIFDSYGPLQ